MPGPSGSGAPSTAGESPATSTNHVPLLRSEARSASAAATTVVPLPPLTDQHVINIRSTSVVRRDRRSRRGSRVRWGPYRRGVTRPTPVRSWPHVASEPLAHLPGSHADEADEHEEDQELLHGRPR